MRRLGLVMQLVAIAIALGAVIVCVVMLATGVAKADEVDDYIAGNADEICFYIDNHPTADGFGVALGSIRMNGFDERDTAWIILETIQETCPRNFPVIQAYIDENRETVQR
jgi:hypothetical protein